MNRIRQFIILFRVKFFKKINEKRIAASSATDVRDLDNFDPSRENLKHFWTHL